MKFLEMPKCAVTLLRLLQPGSSAGRARLVGEAHALLEAGVPSKQKAVEQTPWCYLGNSAACLDNIPWDTHSKRAITPAEGVAWLARERDDLKAIIKNGISALKGGI